VRGNITSYRDFINISIPHFDKRFAGRKICARWVPHCLTAEHKEKRLEIATLLKQRFNAESQASCIELSLLTKRRLETLNQS
jgi:hypothetical protein